MPSSPRRAALIVLVCVAGMAGFEPAADGVKGRCLDRLATSLYRAHRARLRASPHGTSRLFRAVNLRKEVNMKRLEPVTGIEPALPAWKAGALPLSYTDIRCPAASARLTPPGLPVYSGPSVNEKGGILCPGSTTPRWSHQPDLNRRPSEYKSVALPADAIGPCFVLGDGGRDIAQGFSSIPSRQKRREERKDVPAMQNGDGRTGWT